MECCTSFVEREWREDNKGLVALAPCGPVPNLGALGAYPSSASDCCTPTQCLSNLCCTPPSLAALRLLSRVAARVALNRPSLCSQASIQYHMLLFTVTLLFEHLLETKPCQSLYTPLTPSTSALFTLALPCPQAPRHAAATYPSPLRACTTHMSPRPLVPSPLTRPSPRCMQIAAYMHIAAYVPCALTRRSPRYMAI